MQKLKEFCRTENIELLTRIPQNIITELISKSTELLRKHKGNRRLMKSRDKAYWKERCQLAEKYIEESPCDPDIYQAQLDAYWKWKNFKKL